MRAVPLIRNAFPRLAYALVWLLVQPFVSADLTAAPIIVNNPFGQYGTVANTTCPTAPNGICAAVGLINSFSFLKTHYPLVGDNYLDRSTTTILSG